MMADPWPWLVVLALAALTFSMRVGGWLAARAMGVSPLMDRVLRAAPGNLFIAVAAVAVVKGGAPIAAGSVATVLAMHLTAREWVALPVGAAVAAAVAAFA